MTNEEKATEIVDEKYAWCDDLFYTKSDYIKLIKCACIAMAEWKDKEFWSLDNIEKIIVTYNSFPDMSCPHEMVRKTIEKLKPENTKQ